MPFAKATHCHICNRPAVSITEPAKRQRGDKFVIVDQTYDGCAEGCLDYGNVPFAIWDPDSAEINKQRVHEAWMEKYGCEPPPCNRVSATVVSVRMTPELAARMDRARGKRSRSSFLRALLLESAALVERESQTVAE